MSAVKILTLIQETQGTNDKKEILNQNKDNQHVRLLLLAAYNPYMSFGFSNLKPFTSQSTETKEKEFIDLCWTLAKLDINNELREIVDNFLATVSTEAQKIYCAILNKKLSIGIAEKSINKVIPNLIPIFECMLAEPFTEVCFPVLVEEKLDGVRCIITKIDGRVTAYTRKGRTIPIKKLADILREFPSDNLVFDGELLLAGDLRKNTSGKINSLMKSGYQKDIDDKLEYYMFDIMTAEEWASKTSALTALERATEIQNVVGILGRPFFQPTFRIAEAEEHLAYFYKEIRKAGGEGVIIKTNEPYEWKRSSRWQKMKAICSCTLKIVGYTEGTGKNLGKVGAVTCESEDGKIRVDVNPKTDEIRDYITENHFKLLYSKVEVLFNELIEDKDGNHSLFLPRMADNWLRVDKVKADYLEDVIRASKEIK